MMVFARMLKGLGLPIVDAQPVLINVVEPFGVAVDLQTDDLYEAFAAVRALKYTVSEQLGVQADGRRSFTFIVPDSGGYRARFVES